jgi:hypothetical protein
MFSPKGMDLERGWPGRVDGEHVVQLAAQTLQAFYTGGGGAREHAVYPLADVEFRAPVLHPPGIRIFGDDGEFVFANTANVFGPGDAIDVPDFELHGTDALVAVIGADEAIGGYATGVVWRAPDVPGVRTREHGLFLGPFVVTPDEHDGPRLDTERDTAARGTTLRAGELLVKPAS